ncbi:hypothetical protein DH2020_015135 [Rehmannia glutinosa]|uniref:Carbohydrate kinase PfkB domain-containing protein n=1 Tax=Rehmannia glutinosa TaxID=99300 RepID=A0ABR0X243_REHGL
MALHLLHHPHSFALNSYTNIKFSPNYTIFSLKPPKSSSSDTPSTTATTPRRGGRKKSTSTTTPPPSSTKKTKRVAKTAEPSDSEKEAGISKESDNVDELYDYDDGVDFPYDDPPLVCCFGAAQKEFLPTVRVAPEQMHPDIYSQWKMLQWNPPEFVRAPGGPPSNVAISHVRLGGRAAFIGKVGNDEFGEELVLMMNKEKVQTRGVKFDENARTACSYMKINFGEGKMWAEKVKECAEDSLLGSELNLSVLKETREIIKQAWEQADIIEVSKQELEFLLDEEHYERRRNYRPQYYAENYEQTKNRRDYYHYSPEEIMPLWHDRLKFLFVTDGTLRIHYYTPSFDGVVVGTEDVLITPFTCDRTGSGDAVVAGIMRKLTTQPEMFENEDVLVRQLRFAIAAGIISQWTIGAVRGFPTESATQNLKEQVYVPSMW